tara:strand:+ start:705 stop:2615 length:1911 start_codon:yes stop_codon:yes gene_type:complete
MLGAPFTHDVIRKYVVAFGTLFNNIKLQRVGASDTQWISVPLSYAPKEKWYNRLTDPNITQQVAISLPRLSYELVNMSYAPERKMNTLNRHVRVNEQDVFKSMYAPVPYDLQFTLSLYCRNAADATNIVEQILPFFTPEFTVTINDATDLKIDVDCPIVLNGVSREDAYEGDFESRRTVIWTMDFTMKALLFGPVQGTSGIIKKAYVDFFVPSAHSFLTGNAVSMNSTPNFVPEGLSHFDCATSDYYFNNSATLAHYAEDTGSANLFYVSGSTNAELTLNSDYQYTGNRSLRVRQSSGTDDIIILFSNSTPAAVYADPTVLTVDNFLQHGIAVPAETDLIFSAWQRKYSKDSDYDSNFATYFDLYYATISDGAFTVAPEVVAGANFRSFDAGYDAASDKPNYMFNNFMRNHKFHNGRDDGLAVGNLETATHVILGMRFSFPDGADYRIGGSKEISIFIDGMQLETNVPGDLNYGAVGGNDTVIRKFPEAGIIRLASNASSTFGYYKGANVAITHGAGKGNTATIVGYNGTTRIANVFPFFGERPQSNTVYEITYQDPDFDGSIQTGGNKATPTASRVYTQPGLTEDGNPTPDLELSIDVAEIDANDDFGIVQTRTFFHSNNSLYGTRRNLKTGADE